MCLAIAREFNNSASSMRKLEDRIQTRELIHAGIIRGRSGGCTGVAIQTAQNNARIAEAHQLVKNATLNTDVRTTIEDQIRIMEKEQERLQQLATKEQEDRGFFGWLG